MAKLLLEYEQAEASVSATTAAVTLSLPLDVLNEVAESVFNQKVLDVGPGWKARIDPGNSRPGAPKHIHVTGPKGRYRAWHEDGTPSHVGDWSGGPLPPKVREEIEKKTRGKWKVPNETSVLDNLPAWGPRPGNIQIDLTWPLIVLTGVTVYQYLSGGGGGRLLTR